MSPGSHGHASRGGHIRRNQAKKDFSKDKFKDLSLKNAQAIADSIRRRVELTGQKNTMQMFTFQAEDETDENKPDHQHFLRLVRSSHLKRMRARFRRSTSSSTRTPPFATSSATPVPPPDHVASPALATNTTSSSATIFAPVEATEQMEMRADYAPSCSASQRSTSHSFSPSQSDPSQRNSDAIVRNAGETLATFHDNMQSQRQIQIKKQVFYAV